MRSNFIFSISIDLHSLPVLNWSQSDHFLIRPRSTASQDWLDSTCQYWSRKINGWMNCWNLSNLFIECTLLFIVVRRKKRAREGLVPSLFFSHSSSSSCSSSFLAMIMKMRVHLSIIRNVGSEGKRKRKNKHNNHQRERERTNFDRRR